MDLQWDLELSKSGTSTPRFCTFWNTPFFLSQFWFVNRFPKYCLLPLQSIDLRQNLLCPVLFTFYNSKSFDLYRNNLSEQFSEWGALFLNWSLVEIPVQIERFTMGKWKVNWTENSGLKSSLWRGRRPYFGKLFRKRNFEMKDVLLKKVQNLGGWDIICQILWLGRKIPRI